MLLFYIFALPCNAVSLSHDSMGCRVLRANDKKHEELIDYSQSLIRLNSFGSIVSVSNLARRVHQGGTKQRAGISFLFLFSVLFITVNKYFEFESS